MAIKKKELKKNAVERRRTRKEICLLNGDLWFANHISLRIFKRDRRVFLLSVIGKETPEYAWLLKSVSRDEITNGPTNDEDDNIRVLKVPPNNQVDSDSSDG